MLSINQLNTFIDSLEKVTTTGYDYTKRKELEVYMGFMKYLDSGWKDVKVPAVKAKSLVEILPDSAKRDVIETSLSQVNLVKSTLDLNAAEYEGRRTELRLYLVEWHSKFSMASAVLVLFLIGAPLGSIVRKGGIGTPVVFAVIFFVIFFLLNNFGRKFVKQDVLQPVTGIWLAVAVLLPVGLFLIYKARNDSQLMNKEFYSRIFKKVLSAMRSLRRTRKDEIPEPIQH